ncbi:zinc finger protein 1 homolog [Pseudophryne corroboree]|uniref:zinc finger protein 1 homolog n=1 Tax=Pseudophryne corroboree TaxID=495146 RepID=UPI0030818B54
MFSVPKPNGSHRPILNLKSLNKFVRVSRFCMETLCSIILAMEPGDYIVSMDIQDAYLHIPIATLHQKFLRIAFVNLHYQCQALPFGLATAPRILTKVMAVMTAYLRRQGMLILPYLDDLLILANSRKVLLGHLHLTNRPVHVQSDTATMVAYINHQGGTRSRIAMMEVSKILRWAECYLPAISAVFIPGVLNWEADFLSRLEVLVREWALHPKVFQQMVDGWGLPDVDLMASRRNHKGTNVEEEEETYVMGYQQCKEEEISTDISTDEYNSGYTSQGQLIFSAYCKIEDKELTPDPPGETPIYPVIHPDNHSANILSNSTSTEECPPHQSTIVLPYSGHTGELFPCPECGKCFPHKSDLVTHLRIHLGQKLFLCVDCGKYFTHKSTFVTHRRTHTVEKPFSCSECGKCFARKASLLAHEASHTGQTPFSCSECGKYFTCKASLIKHQMIHTRECPFSCAECGKCFPHKSTLKTHQRSHWSKGPFPCSVCGKCFTRIDGTIHISKYP